MNKAKMKKECYTCRYYTGKGTKRYKCFTPKCPVYTKPVREHLYVKRYGVAKATITVTNSYGKMDIQRMTWIAEHINRILKAAELSDAPSTSTITIVIEPNPNKIEE